MAAVRAILTNGNILTMGSEPKAEAVACGWDGRILAVGAASEVGNLAAAGTPVIDLNGRTLVPGFFDCHMHPLWLGESLGNVGLDGVSNVEEIVRRLRERLETQPDIACVQGSSYNQNNLPGAVHITRRDLDRVSIEKPVRVIHSSLHAAVVNSKALEILGIAWGTPDPLAGEIVRDAEGEPTGVLLETASWLNLERLIPPPTSAQALESLGRANTYLLERGVTSASDAHASQEMIPHYSRAVAMGGLRVRMNLMVGWAEIARDFGMDSVPSPDAMQPTDFGFDWHRLNVGQAKLFADGAITTRTCWLTDPFEGMPDNFGIPNHETTELFELIAAAHNAGWQIATHAIGDRAIDVVLQAYAEAQRRKARFRPGHRIEHCMLLDDELIARLRRQNVWSIGQPEFLAHLGESYILALGEERTNRLSPYATLEARGVAQAFSSDNPIVPGAPLDGLRAAMERKTPTGRILNAEERLSAETALYAYTAAAAFATRTDRDRGSIETGKLADFALLSADPTTVPIDEWDRVQVESTFIGGDCLYGEEKVT